MHSLVCQIGRVGKWNGLCSFSVVFLLVHNKVLGTSNDTSILDTLNRFTNSDTCENWVGAEA